jgi:hypothetical protein
MPGWNPFVPDGGELYLGKMIVSSAVNSGPLGGMLPLLDIVNASETNDEYGAWVSSGFGGPVDPDFFRGEVGTPAHHLLTQGWRLPNGQSGDGPLGVVPEPSTILLFAFGLTALKPRSLRKA